MWHVHRVVAKLYKTTTVAATNFANCTVDLYWKHAYGMA